MKQAEPDRIELSDTYLTNERNRRPDEPIEYYAFTTEIRGKHRLRNLITLAGKTREEADAKLVEFVSRPDVELVDEQGHKIEKGL